MKARGQNHTPLLAVIKITEEEENGEEAKGGADKETSVVAAVSSKPDGIFILKEEPH